MFCSQSCLKQATETYHPKESELVEILNEAGYSEWHIALRAILSQPVNYYLENFTGNHDPTYGSNLQANETYASNDLKSLFNLQSCLQFWPVHRLHFQAFVAYFYLKCLAKVGYLESAPGDPLTSEELIISKLLMHIMNVSSTNAHEFGKFDDNGCSNLMEGSVYPVGGTLTPSMVLLSHSCDPNTIRYQNGKHTILMANRTINEGEEVCLTYKTWMQFQLFIVSLLISGDYHLCRNIRRACF